MERTCREGTHKVQSVELPKFEDLHDWCVWSSWTLFPFLIDSDASLVGDLVDTDTGLAVFHQCISLTRTALRRMRVRLHDRNTLHVLIVPGKGRGRLRRDHSWICEFLHSTM
jgi:hypothetical protein